jgi:Undecaprenyl-phosphate glucose phosphotransferase
MSILQEAPPAPPEPEREPSRQSQREARTRPYLVPEWINTRRRPPDLLHIGFVLVQLVLDAALVALAFIIAFLLRFNSDIIGSFAPPSTVTYTIMLIVTTLSVVVVFNFYGLYRLQRGYSRIDEFYKVVAAVSSALFVSIAVNSFILADRFIYARWILAIGWVLSILFVSVGRFLYSISAGFLRRHGVARQRVLIIGTGAAARTVWQRILGAPSLGYEMVGFVAARGEQPDESADESLRIVGYSDELAHLVQLYDVNEIVVALPGGSHEDVLDIVSAVEDEQLSIRVYPDTFQLIINNDLGLNDINGLPLVSVRDVTLRGFNKVIKRAFDIAFSAGVLILFSPLMLLVAILIKLESPGAVFFVQERVGLDGQPIQVIKFRSMRADAEQQGTWTTANDPRRTQIGRFIRRFSIDELPQFINVLLGEMSIVGPRPEQPQYVAQFSQAIPRYMRRHKEKTGLTGWAQVNGLRGDTSIEERTRYDLYYVENWSLLLDLKIIVRTIVRLFTDRSAY